MFMWTISDAIGLGLLALTACVFLCIGIVELCRVALRKLRKAWRGY